MKNILNLLLIIALLFSCSSRQKATQLHKDRREVLASVDSVASAWQNVNQHSSIVEHQTELRDNESLEAAVSSGDSLSIKIYNATGKLISRKVISGSGRAIISQSARITDSQKIGVKQTLSQQSSVAHTKKSTTDSSSSIGRSMTLKRTGSTVWSYVILIIIIIVIIVIRYVRKTYLKNMS